MVKTRGSRNSGVAKFFWRKTDYQDSPLWDDQINYLAELALVIRQLTDGKTRSEERQEHIEGRLVVCEEILGESGIEITYSNALLNHFRNNN